MGILIFRSWAVPVAAGLPATLLYSAADAACSNRFEQTKVQSKILKLFIITLGTRR